MISQTSRPIISAKGLGKRYSIRQAAAKGPDMLRDAISGALKKMIQRAARRAQGYVAPESTVEDFWALRDITFDVLPGESIAIIGRNGAGKSTLLKLLSRITEPTEGRAVVRGRLASLLEVGTGFHPELTGRENIFLNGAMLGMSRREIAAKFDEIVAFAEVERFLDTQVKYYSSGMYVRLAFAVAAHLEPDILVIDEVLAVGDAAFQKKCLQKMDSVARSSRRTLLFVSHNLALVSALCSRAYLLDGGRIVAEGRTSEVVQRYQAMAGDGGAHYRVRTPLVEWGGLESDGHSELRADSDVCLRFTLHIGNRDLRDVDLDINITNERDETVLHARSKLVVDSLTFSTGTTVRAQYRIKSPKLVPGAYYLMVYVAESADVALWVERVPAFTVTAAAYFGVLEVLPDLQSPVIPEFELALSMDRERELVGA